MKYTGVFATESEQQAIKDTANTPLIAINTGMPPTPQQVAHGYALKHGLPEIEGYYGIDLRTGEFVSA